MVCDGSRYRLEFCPIKNSRQQYYNGAGECVDATQLLYNVAATSGRDPNTLLDRDSGSGRVGDVCAFNTDCLGGMYCASGTCRCLSTYVAVDTYCYESWFLRFLVRQ